MRNAISSFLLTFLVSCSNANGVSLTASQLSFVNVSSSAISSEAYASPISKVNDYDTFSAFFPAAQNDPNLSAISTSFFDAAILFFVPFVCDSGEKQYGVQLEGINGTNNDLVFSISVASTFTDEAFEKAPFLISVERSVFGSFGTFSFNAYKRDTKEKGTCYYDENGNRR